MPEGEFFTSFMKRQGTYTHTRKFCVTGVILPKCWLFFVPSHSVFNSMLYPISFGISGFLTTLQKSYTQCIRVFFYSLALFLSFVCFPLLEFWYLELYENSEKYSIKSNVASDSYSMRVALFLHHSCAMHHWFCSIYIPEETLIFFFLFWNFSAQNNFRIHRSRSARRYHAQRQRHRYQKYTTKIRLHHEKFSVEISSLEFIECIFDALSISD